MIILKLTPVFCVLALGAMNLPARADDNPAQAAARAALAQQGLDAGSSPTVTPESNPAKTIETAPTPQPAVAAQQYLPAQAGDNPAQAAARAALAQQGLNAGGSPTIAPKATAMSSEEVKVRVKAKTEKKHKEKKVETALAPKPVVAARPVAAPQPTPAPQPAPAAANNYLGKDLGMRPLPTPALPISASKEARLAALLAKYQADQITPAEYHEQRAAILAEP